jgi:hypothetical protein
LAVDGEAHFRGVGVFLAVVLPPANRAQPQGAGRIQCLVAAARASIAHFDRVTHTGMDGKTGVEDYEKPVARAPQRNDSKPAAETRKTE